MAGLGATGKLSADLCHSLQHHIGVVLTAAALAAEVLIVRYWLQASLSSPQWIALASARGYSWRVIANTASYAPQPPSSWWLDRVQVAVPRQATASLALLGDGILGLLLHVPVLLLCLIPCIEQLHIPCLLHTSRAQLLQAASDHQGAFNDHFSEEASVKKGLFRRGTVRMSCAIRSSVAPKEGPLTAPKPDKQPPPCTVTTTASAVKGKAAASPRAMLTTPGAVAEPIETVPTVAPTVTQMTTAVPPAVSPVLAVTMGSASIVATPTAVAATPIRAAADYQTAQSAYAEQMAAVPVRATATEVAVAKPPMAALLSTMAAAAPVAVAGKQDVVKPAAHEPIDDDDHVDDLCRDTVCTFFELSSADERSGQMGAAPQTVTQSAAEISGAPIEPLRQGAASELLGQISARISARFSTFTLASSTTDPGAVVLPQASTDASPESSVPNVVGRRAHAATLAEESGPSSVLPAARYMGAGADPELYGDDQSQWEA